MAQKQIYPNLQHTDTKNHKLKVIKQILLLQSQQLDESDGSNLPQIDKSSFIVKSTKSKELSQKSQAQYYDQNQFRLYSIASKRRNRKSNTNQIVDNKKNIVQLLASKVNQVGSLNSKFHSKLKKKASSGFDQLNNPNDKLIQDLYKQYLTMEQLQQTKARKKLQKKMDKYMPKNSSFSQFYGEKRFMIDKQAKQQENQLSKQISKSIGQQEQSRKEKILFRKKQLHQILSNKRLDFKNKLRQRSYSKGQRTPFSTIPDKLKFQKERAQSNFENIHSPTYSDESQNGKKILFFPQPKITKNINTNLPAFSSPHQTIDPRMKSGRLSRIKSTSEQYLKTLVNLQQVSQLQTKRSQYLINSSIKKQQQFQKNYEQLNEQTIQAIYGFRTLKLQQQTSTQYRQQLRSMWMQNDLSKGKRNVNSNSKKKQTG